VIISTHSATILETIRELGGMKTAPDAAHRFCSLFSQGHNKNLKEMTELALGLLYKG